MARRRPKVKIQKLEPPVKTNGILSERADGDICLLSCGCQIQRMTAHPRNWDMVNCRLLSWCTAGDPNARPSLSVCNCPAFAQCALCFLARICQTKTAKRRLVAGICWTVDISKYTEVQYDNLASELAVRFS